MTISASSRILASDFLHLKFLPVGTVLMYDGTNWSDNSTIDGWYSCCLNDTTAKTVADSNVNGGTVPNLVDRFIRASSSSEEGTDGIDSTTLTSDTMPRHSHNTTAVASLASTAPAAHSHTAGTYSCPGRSMTAVSGYMSTPLAVDAGHIDNMVVSKTASDTHTHSVSISIGNMGTDPSVSLLPDYYRLIYIIKMK